MVKWTPKNVRRLPGLLIRIPIVLTVWFAEWWVKAGTFLCDTYFKGLD